MGESDKSQDKPGVVDFGETFLHYYLDRYSKTTVSRIDDFIEHFEENGLWGWQGKVGPSDRVPETYENRDEIIAHAQKHKLWHAHIGEPVFKYPKGHTRYLVSDWVIHFQKIDNYKIKLLELGYHNPMELPSETLILESESSEEN